MLCREFMVLILEHSTKSFSRTSFSIQLFGLSDVRYRFSIYPALFCFWILCFRIRIDCAKILSCKIWCFRINPSANLLSEKSESVVFRSKLLAIDILLYEIIVPCTTYHTCLRVDKIKNWQQIVLLSS